ncbi:MAG: hypothetical protein ACR2FY_01315 [Pirellulaceae bacterium]
MNRPTNVRIGQLVGSLALVTITFASVVHAAPPAAFGTRETQHTISDQETPVPSGIVWGPTSEDYRSCDFVRAGCPQCQRKITIPSNNRHYGGYYVGGGTPTRGAGRCDDDGTWGWDYAGILFTKRIALNWTAKGRSQGGTGAYKTDGPKLRRE